MEQAVNGPDAARLDAVIPRPVRGVCEQLRAAGHQAVTVGGAVRDALLGRVPGDWDVATSATPAQVMALFRRTIPTGVQHGTVTVLMGHGEARMAVEVTTFRGEGAYSDARRPDSVTFGVPLREDLARRDFVINAIAYDPVDRALVDPFGGQADLARRQVRAVGAASERFAEDGLRVMRAVRFAAVLGFELDADTEAAIPGALSALARVSQERVRVELFKMLDAPSPSRGLVIARRTGVLASILPELDTGVGDPGVAGQGDGASRPGEPAAGARAAGAWPRTLARVDAAARAGAGTCVRLAALLWDISRDAQDAGTLDAALRRLKLSNAERADVASLVRHGPAWRDAAGSDEALRRMLGRVTRARARDLLALWQADLAAGAGDEADDPSGSSGPGGLDALCTRARAILDAGEPLAVGELAITGGEIMNVLGIPPGRIIGRVLEALLARVLADPSLNTRERLVALVPAIHADLAD